MTALFETVTLQLKSKAVTVKAGTLVDATILAFADSAYRGNHFRDAVLAKGGVPRIVATGMWGRVEAETLRKLHAWDQPIHRVRGRIEKILARGSEVMASDEYDGEVSPKPPPKSTSPPSPTTSSAP